MDRKIQTYSTLSNLVDIDPTDHIVKDMAVLLLKAMNDWPTVNQDQISDFTKELTEYFGVPLKIQQIIAKRFDRDNAWQIEAGTSICELIDTSEKIFEESEIDNIIKNVLDYYEREFAHVDFIAKLTYRTREENGRLTAAHNGYRPQVKFEFSDKQTSGQQHFIDRDVVLPGETVLSKIKLLSPNFFANCLSEGTTFEFREGAKVIGTGKIVKIVNDSLQVVSR